MKVIISGGGTGGHIYPAIAIANALREKNDAVQVLFVGALGRMEMQRVPAAGYKIVGLPISGIQRSLSLKNLMFPYKVLKSIWKSRSVLKSYKADVAIGVGGYASWPLLHAASMLGIPTMIQEQNSYAGISNKFLAKKATKICVAYDGMEAFFPKEKLVLTGNPVRKDILESGDKRNEALQFFGLDGNKKTLLVIGGSLGARTINESVAAGLETLLNEDIQLVWQTGKSYIDNCNKVAMKFNDRRIKVFPFIAEMNLAYAAADIVVSRAGALSISELCLVGKPAVFVPSPNVAEDHQTKNAQALTSKNAGLMVKDAEAMAKLIPTAVELLKDKGKQQMFSQNIKKLGKPDAANEIANIVFEILKSNKE